jgi:photosystem II stability/assembly factor-like uncharacterized protein
MLFCTFQSANSQTWTLQSSGINTGYLFSVSSVDSNVCWAGSQTGYIIKTTNGGINWTNVGGGVFGSNSIYTVCAISGTTALASISPGSTTYVYRTTDGGSNWTQVFTQGGGGFINHIMLNETGTMFMFGDPVGGRWSFWKSSDYGITWDSTGMYLPRTGNEIGYFGSMCFHGNKIWFGTYQINPVRIYYSTNLGLSWQYGNVNIGTGVTSVAFNDSNIGFAAGPPVKSTDGGATWSPVTLPTGTGWNGFYYLANRFWYCGQSIYFSSDNGATFSMQFANSTFPIHTHFNLSGNKITGWAVGVSGTILKYNEDGVVTSTTHETSNIPNGYSLSQNYPNPRIDSQKR